MLLGLKRGEVALCAHQPEWAEKAAEVICALQGIFGEKARDIQHVGSTAIQQIKAKPMLDIAVGVERLDGLEEVLRQLETIGFYKSSTQPLPGEILCAMKETRASETVLCNLHIELIGSAQWNDHVNFRDYMNAFPEKAAAYEALKCRLAEHFPHDRTAYLEGKTPLIKACILEAGVVAALRKTHDVTAFEPVTKGWSSDKKYRLQTADGNTFLVRVADIAQYEAKQAEFEAMKRVAALGIPMQQPVDFGVCNGGSHVFLLLTWMDGKDAEEVLPLLSEAEQYSIGMEAGKILKKMQTAEVTAPSDDWFHNYGVKIDRYIQNYRNCGLTFDGDEQIIAFIEQNRHRMKHRPMCLTHDDYHPGNLILNQDHALLVIDFQRLRMVEPYHALTGLQFSASTCPHFAAGQLNAYFDGEPPEDFWRLHALYMACVAVNALPWSIPYGQGEVDFAYKQIAEILSWYDGMQSVVPTWYIKNFYIQYTDGVPYKLKSALGVTIQ